MFFRKKPQVESLLPPAPPPGMPAQAIPTPVPAVPAPPPIAARTSQMETLPSMFGEQKPIVGPEPAEQEQPQRQPEPEPAPAPEPEPVVPIATEGLPASPKVVLAPSTLPRGVAKGQTHIDSELESIRKQLDDVSVPEASVPQTEEPASELDNVLEQFQAELSEVQQTQEWLSKQEDILQRALSAAETAISSRSKPFGAEMKMLSQRYDGIERRLDTNEKHIKEILVYLHRLDNHLKAKKPAKRSR